MSPYIPNTDDDRRQMLGRIGVKEYEDLLAPVPKSARLRSPLNMPPALSEIDLMHEVDQIARENKPLICFAGGGVYDHFIPAAVNTIISRPEFMTAYTPYQAEVSQGLLQVIYEFQTHICRLTGMEVANASMYDGASAAAEAVLTSIVATNRKKVIVSGALNPVHTEVIRTYARGFEGEISILPFGGGVSDLNRLEDMANSKTACFVVSHPNFFGTLEDVEGAANIIHQVGGLMIVAADPISLALLKPPGEMGADIVVGEGQPLGIPVSFGGPLLGLYATKKSLIRRLPGRLVARTVDAEGKPGFTLTLQTREQHIRRAKATSNICTNEALCATAATVFLSLMGKQGLRRVADIALERAHYAADKISALDGYSLAFAAPFHREFVIKTPIPASAIIKKLCSSGILAGIDLARFYPEMKNHLLIAVTEKRTYEEVDRLVESFRELYVNRDEPIEVVG